MKKFLFALMAMLTVTSVVYATSLEIIEKGEGFEYPLQEDATIACYAKELMEVLMLLKSITIILYLKIINYTQIQCIKFTKLIKQNN